MKTIKRLLWLFLIILVIVAGVQVKGGYDKYLKIYSIAIIRLW